MIEDMVKKGFVVEREAVAKKRGGGGERWEGS